MIDRVRISRQTSLWISGVTMGLCFICAVLQWTSDGTLWVKVIAVPLAVDLAALFWPKKPFRHKQVDVDTG